MRSAIGGVVRWTARVPSFCCKTRYGRRRAAISAARLAAAPERATNGRRLLAEVYDSFTEGFNTRDLCAARETLAQLDA